MFNNFEFFFRSSGGMRGGASDAMFQGGADEALPLTTTDPHITGSRRPSFALIPQVSLFKKTADVFFNTIAS